MNSEYYWDGSPRTVVINIRLVAGQTNYPLPDKSVLNKRSRWISIAHREPGGNRKTKFNKALINESCFRAAHILLRSSTDTDHLRNVPLEIAQFRQNNNFGHMLGGACFDLANSNISIADETTIIPDEEIELLITYIPPEKQY